MAEEHLFALRVIAKNSLVRFEIDSQGRSKGLEEVRGPDSMTVH